MVRLGALVLGVALIAAACGSDTRDPAAEPVTSEVPSPTEAPAPDPAPVLVAAAELREQVSSATAGAFVDAVQAQPTERWVPWLIDLLRFDPSTTISKEIRSTLADITGIPSEVRILDMTNYGSWAFSRGLDGGDEYRAFKVSLYQRIDDRFGPLLESVADQTELAAIQWGGVPVGGIPELNDPARVPAADADWMVDDEVVLGVVVDDEAVAYPLRILARHELANDTIGGDPLAIVYCTLCRSAIVYEREIEGQVVQFLTSGLLSNSNKVMLDVETQTLWSHLRGVGIGGTHLGTELDVRAVNHMRWSDWVAENPDTLVLELPAPIFFDDPERPPIAYDYTPGVAYASYYDDPDVWFPIIDTPDTWPLKTEVIGIEHEGDELAFSVEDLNLVGDTITVEVGGTTFTVEPTGVGARVFGPDGERVIVEQSFWFAWFANHPDTRTLTEL